MLALAHVELREPAAAIPLLDEVIPLTEKFRFAQLHGLYLGFRGEAALQAGDPAAALEFARLGSEITQRAGYAYGLGWTQRIMGRIAHASGHPAQARAQLEEAIATFRDMGAPFEAGRAHLELGELLESAADQDGARIHAEAALEILQALAPEAFIDRARKLKSRLAAPASTPAGN
jgi:tetratricopeptide (TPR) repeat protein